MHQVREHLEQTPDGQSKCFKCDFTGRGRRTMLVHMRKDHYKVLIELTCETCGMTFPTSDRLKSHQKMVHVERKFPCPHCDQKFKISTALKKHLWAVHNEGNGPIYTCEQCGRTFKMKNLWQTHMIRHHSKEGPCVCDLCGKSYTNQLSLKDHVATSHEQEKVPTPCDVCQKVCSSLRAMWVHRRRLHENPEPIKDKKCQFCPEMFVNNSTRKIHERNIHLGIKDFACDQCDYKCGRQATLTYHKNAIHSGQMFDCDYPGCTKSYNAKGNLDAHRFRVHKIPRPKQLQQQ